MFWTINPLQEIFVDKDTYKNVDNIQPPSFLFYPSPQNGQAVFVRLLERSAAIFILLYKWNEQCNSEKHYVDLSNKYSY